MDGTLWERTLSEGAFWDGTRWDQSIWEGAIWDGTLWHRSIWELTLGQQFRLGVYNSGADYLGWGTWRAECLGAFSSASGRNGWVTSGGDCLGRDRSTAVSLVAYYFATVSNGWETSGALFLRVGCLGASTMGWDMLDEDCCPPYPFNIRISLSVYVTLSLSHSHAVSTFSSQFSHLLNERPLRKRSILNGHLCKIRDILGSHFR